MGLIPKVYLPNYGEFYEQRWFASGSGVEHGIELCGQHVSLCTNQTFACDTMPNLVIGVEICEICGPRRRPPWSWPGRAPP